MQARPRTEGADGRLSRRRHGGAASTAIILGIAAIGAALVFIAYWPGVMIDDARWQYQQAVDNSYEDWHPPLMAWVWRRLAFIVTGPAPMFLLQLLLYWVGVALIASGPSGGADTGLLSQSPARAGCRRRSRSPARSSRTC